MTVIKYATVARARETSRLVLLRGKKTGKVGYRPPDDDDKHGPFGDPLYSERVVELPEPMSPTEYRDWVEDLDSTSDNAVTAAFRNVADEYDADAGIFSAESGGNSDPDPATDGGPDHDVPVSEQLTDRQRELVEDNGGPDNE